MGHCNRIMWGMDHLQCCQHCSAFWSSFGSSLYLVTITRLMAAVTWLSEACLWESLLRKFFEFINIYMYFISRNFKKYFYVCASMYHMCLQRSEEACSLELKFRQLSDSRCWELSMGALEERFHKTGLPWSPAWARKETSRNC